MNINLTNPQQPAPHADKPTGEALNRAAQIAAAVDAVYEQPTSYNNPDLPSWQDGPRIGTTPPIDQPGRPSMSRKAVDDTARMIGASVVIVATGAATTAVLWGSGHADPEVIAWVCAAPVGLAVPILALSSLVKRIKQAAEAAPPVIHQHFNGDVHQDQRQVNTTNRAIIATTRNQLPR